MKTREVKRGDTTYSVPTDWSDNAVDIFIDRYCRSYQDIFQETSIESVFKRLVNFWFDDPTLQLQLLQDMWYQHVSPNSPQYFNAGIAKSYGVAGNDIGLWTIASGKPLMSYNTYIHPQLHACFIQPIEDSIAGIRNLLDSESRLFSRGSGTGTNFSDLRGRDEPITSGGTSSGLISFLKVFDANAGAIKSGGTTRRAAKMVVVDVDHPDIFEFVNWKVNEEKKARILIEHGGYEDSWEGEAYQTVSGQNSNNSIRVSDAFMLAVENKRPWTLTNRTDDGKKQINAERLWHEICQAAWYCADPGIQFSDTINKWNTTPNCGDIRASNPCSEHLRLDNSACNLASINLVSLLKDGEFHIKQLCDLTRRWVRVLDRSIDLAGYPTRDIAEGTRLHRDIGLGFCGLGALLMRMGIPYDSDEGRQTATLIAAVINAVAYDESTIIAEEDCPYPKYFFNDDHHKRVLSMHMDALQEASDLPSHRQLYQLAYDHYKSASIRAKQTGIRNAQLTVVAPTGTIGITMDCETTGIEPVFALTATKTLSGGGELKQTVQSLDIGLQSLRYGEHVRKAICAEAKKSGTVQVTGWLKEQHRSVFRTAVGDGRLQLSPFAHVKMLAAVQPHVSGGISKTVNLPNNATVDDISNVYKRAWYDGVKCIAVYRDGCKSQPLTSDCKKCGDDESCDL